MLTNKQFYQVKFLEAVKPNSSYRYNRTCGVAAENAIEAALRVASEFPGCRVDAVNHHGQLDFINDTPRPNTSQD